MVSKELFNAIPIAQIDFVQFLLKNGFLKLALSLTDHLSENRFKNIPSCPKDVLEFMKGLIYLEGIGQGNEARKHFERAVGINPLYPQAARLASTYAINYNDAIRYNNLFYDSMAKCLKNSTNDEDFSRFGKLDEDTYKRGKSAPIQKDMLAAHGFMYYKMDELKNIVKQLAFGSLVTELIRSGTQTQVPEDLQMAIVRNNIELGITLAKDIAAKQKEYAQFTCPQDDLVLQNTLAQASFYLQRYDPYDVVAINWKAYCLLSLSKYEECIESCDFAIKIKPSGYYFHYVNKALALSYLGRKREVEALIPILIRESRNSSIKEDIEKSIPKQCQTIDETKQFFYHYIEAAAYAAEEELNECITNGRIEYLKDFVYKLNRGNNYSKDDLLLLTTFYTPAMMYYFINKNAVYTNRQFLNMLLYMVESIDKGFLDEMAGELCWTFALSYKDYDFFTPLRDKLIDNFGNETIALAIQRIGWTLYNVLQKYH